MRFVKDRDWVKGFVSPFSERFDGEVRLYGASSSVIVFACFRGLGAVT